MRRPLAVIAAVLGAAIFLAACEISIDRNPPPQRTPDDEVRATLSAIDPVSGYSLPAGADLLVWVEVPSNVRSSYQAVHFEISQNLDLQLFGANGRIIASSRSPNLFAAGNAGLAAATLGPQAVVTPGSACAASCIIQEIGGNPGFFVLITNRSGNTQSVDFYAYGDDYRDEFEPSNNSRATTQALLLAADRVDESGAIESIDDVDYWLAVGSGTIRFLSSASAIDIRAAIVDLDGQLRGDIHVPGGPAFPIFSGEYLKVWSINGYAAASAESTYSLIKTN